MTRQCPFCGSFQIIMFNSDNDLCQECNKWFPDQGDNFDETKLNLKDKYPSIPCTFPCSTDKSDYKTKYIKVMKALEDMHFAYINKDADNPHQFEKDALKAYEKIKSIPEAENHKSMEWYEEQVKELQEIKRRFYEICGDTANGDDYYFPALLEIELEKLKK